MVACDMPSLNPDLIRLLCNKPQNTDAVVSGWQSELLEFDA